MRHLLLLLLLVAPGCGDPAGTALRGQDTIEKARVVRAEMEIRQLRTEVEQHHGLRGEWPEAWADLKRAAVDPWGNPYELEIDEGRAIVFSAGKDGKAGTRDDVHAE